MHTRVAHTSNELLTQGWEGRGASAFAKEMADVLPALDRLQHALREANQVTLEIARIMREAEEEAASLFDADGRQGSNVQMISTSTDRIVDHIGDFLDSLFSSPSERLSEGLDYLEQTTAGRQLLEEAAKNNLAFRFPDGTVIGSQNDGATIVDIAYGKIDDDDTSAVYSDDDKMITLNEDKIGHASAEQFAGVLAHEMQHALDYQKGLVSHDIYYEILTNLWGEDSIPKNLDDEGVKDFQGYAKLDSEAQKTIREKLADYLELHIETEIRAFERMNLVNPRYCQPDGSIPPPPHMPYTLDESELKDKRSKFLDNHSGYREHYEEWLRNVLPDNYDISIGFDEENELHVSIDKTRTR
jgi:WXG100 family type VII secretion target